MSRKKQNEVEAEPEEAPEGWISNIMNNPAVQLCAVFLVCTVLMKACDFVEAVGDKNTYEGRLPDCKVQMQSKISAGGRTYDVMCPN